MTCSMAMSHSYYVKHDVLEWKTRLGLETHCKISKSMQYRQDLMCQDGTILSETILSLQ